MMGLPKQRYDLLYTSTQRKALHSSILHARSSPRTSSPLIPDTTLLHITIEKLSSIEDSIRPAKLTQMQRNASISCRDYYARHLANASIFKS